VNVSEVGREIQCDECLGACWSRSASGRCTPCRGAGVMHMGEPEANRPVQRHGGRYAECAWCLAALEKKAAAGSGK
jgi:hypothetical protein